MAEFGELKQALVGFMKEDDPSYAEPKDRQSVPSVIPSVPGYVQSESTNSQPGPIFVQVKATVGKSRRAAGQSKPRTKVSQPRTKVSQPRTKARQSRTTVGQSRTAVGAQGPSNIELEPTVTAQQSVPTQPKPALQQKPICTQPNPVQQQSVSGQPKSTFVQQQPVPQQYKQVLLQQSVSTQPNRTVIQQQSVSRPPKPTFVQERFINTQPYPTVMEQQSVSGQPKPTFVQQQPVPPEPKPALQQQLTFTQQGDIAKEHPMTFGSGIMTISDFGVAIENNTNGSQQRCLAPTIGALHSGGIIVRGPQARSFGQFQGHNSNPLVTGDQFTVPRAFCAPVGKIRDNQAPNAMVNSAVQWQIPTISREFATTEIIGMLRKGERLSEEDKAKISFLEKKAQETKILLYGNSQTAIQPIGVEAVETAELKAKESKTLLNENPKSTVQPSGARVVQTKEPKSWAMPSLKCARCNGPCAALDKLNSFLITEEQTWRGELEKAEYCCIDETLVNNVPMEDGSLIAGASSFQWGKPRDRILVSKMVSSITKPFKQTYKYAIVGQNLQNAAGNSSTPILSNHAAWDSGSLVPAVGNYTSAQEPVPNEPPAVWSPTTPVYSANAGLAPQQPASDNGGGKRTADEIDEGHAASLAKKVATQAEQESVGGAEDKLA